MSDQEHEEHGRNPTQRRMDAEGTSDKPADVDWEEPQLSEVIPEDPDRGGDGAIGDDDQDEGGTGADDGGPGSQNM